MIAYHCQLLTRSWPPLWLLGGNSQYPHFQKRGRTGSGFISVPWHYFLLFLLRQGFEKSLDGTLQSSCFSLTEFREVRGCTPMPNLSSTCQNQFLRVCRSPSKTSPWSCSILLPSVVKVTFCEKESHSAGGLSALTASVPGEWKLTVPRV